MTPIQTQPKPIPVRIPTAAETAVRKALHQDARTHLGRMFAPQR